jgi:uncharacterized protein (UPF0333 family)
LKRGQLSLEMLIILVILLAVAALVASVLMKSANKAASEVEKKTESVFNTTSPIKQSGQFCTSDDECASKVCDSTTNKCL